MLRSSDHRKSELRPPRTGSALRRIGGGVAAALLVSSALYSLASNAGQMSWPVGLRGTKPGPVVHKSPVETPLRGAIVSGDVLVDQTGEGEQQEATINPLLRPTENTFGQDVRDGWRFIGKNLGTILLRRGSQTAIADRDIAYEVPERPVLRQSLLPSANLYEGLRSSTSGVGDTVANALRGSYSTRARLEQANADRARVYSALTSYLPRLEGVVDADVGQDSGSTRSTALNRSVRARAELTMPLYTSGVNLNTYRRAKNLSIASDYSYLAEEYRVALEAITAHVNLRLNRQIEKRLKGNVDALKQIATVSRKLFKAGDVSKTDIAVAQANVEGARAELDLARRAREETERDYESLTGKDAPKGLGDGRYQRLVPKSREDAVEMAIRNNPTLASSLHSALASKYAAKAERGRYGPQVNLVGSYDADLYNSDGRRNDEAWNIGVRLRVPLIDGSLVPNVGAARAEALQAEYEALDQSRRIEQQVGRQWAAYRSAARRTDVLTRQVRNVAASVKGIQREYKAGFKSLSELLTEQVKLIRAQIALESARHEKMLAAYQLAISTANPELRNFASVH